MFSHKIQEITSKLQMMCCKGGNFDTGLPHLVNTCNNKICDVVVVIVMLFFLLLRNYQIKFNELCKLIGPQWIDRLPPLDLAGQDEWDTCCQ